ncbi:MAG TPA: hypothetical protein VHL14_06425 [Steroidobacteraceae bacterium]|nr:hypothetical protein [Steroidobacteraceae bacterium]
MTPFRALLIPFQFSSVLPVLGLSLLLTLAVRSDITGILWILPAFITTSWLFKYAFIMLEHVADGEHEAPVVSLEMLGPFEQRPLFLLVVAVAIGSLLWRYDTTPGYVLVGAIVLALPAAIGVLGATRQVKLALNPVVILQTMRGMGWWYVVLLTLIAAVVASTMFLLNFTTWRVLSYVQIGFCVLMIFSLIGGVMYERRIEIGHEPRKSPERIAVQDQRERQRTLQRVLDEMYRATRLGDLVDAMTQLEKWQSGVTADHDHRALAQDVEMIHTTVMGWNDPGMLTATGRALATLLNQNGCTEALEELIATTLRSQPDFTFKSESALLPVIHGLQAERRVDLARQLVTNFVNTFPAQVTPGVNALLQRLSVVKP